MVSSIPLQKHGRVVLQHVKAHVYTIADKENQGWYTVYMYVCFLQPKDDLEQLPNCIIIGCGWYHSLQYISNSGQLMAHPASLIKLVVHGIQLSWSHHMWKCLWGGATCVRVTEGRHSSKGRWQEKGEASKFKLRTYSPLEFQPCKVSVLATILCLLSPITKLTLVMGVSQSMTNFMYKDIAWGLLVCATC